MLLLLVIVSFISACGGGDSASKGSDDSGSSSNTSEGESGSSSSGDSSSTNGGETSDGSSGGDTSGGDTSGGDTSGGDTSGGGTTASTYSPYAGGTGRGAVRLKTVTNSSGSVHTFYYNDDPIKAGTLSHEIEDKSFETLTRKYEYSLGSLSKMTVYAIEDSGEVTRDDIVNVNLGTIQFEPINDLIVSSADVTRVDKGKTYEYSKTYTYLLNTSGHAIALKKVATNSKVAGAINEINYEHDNLGRLERLRITSPNSPIQTVFKYVYDAENKPKESYFGFIDTNSKESEKNQFIGKDIFSYKKGLGGVALVDKVTSYSRANGSKPWEHGSVASYEYENGECNYHVLYVQPIVDGIDTPLVKILCPH